MNWLSMSGLILRAMRSNRSAVLLLTLEIALTLAVLCNLFSIIATTMQRAAIDSGVEETTLGVMQSIGIVGSGDDAGSTAHALAALREIPGITAAAFGSPPFSADRTALFLDPQAEQPAAHGYLFFGSQDLDRTLGVRVLQGQPLHAGHIPTATELKQTSPMQLPALITASLARRLFGDANPLGQLVYGSIWSTPASLRIVGVIAPLAGASSGHAEDHDVVLAEIHLEQQNFGGMYLLRSQPGQLQQVLPLAAAAMQQARPNSVQQMVKSMTQSRVERFQNEQAMARMLGTLSIILLFGTALGIAGLASYWVQQRNHQIGIRRALGARRSDILGHFLIENLLIATTGVLLGSVLAVLLNNTLMQHFELQRLPTTQVLLGVICMLLISQLAVLGPALRATRIAPAIATRSI